jgi:hypothetical protein
LCETQEHLLDEILIVGSVMRAFAKEAEQGTIVPACKGIERRVALQLTWNRLRFGLVQHGLPMT